MPKLHKFKMVAKKQYFAIAWLVNDLYGWFKLWKGVYRFNKANKWPPIYTMIGPTVSSNCFCNEESLNFRLSTP